MHPLVRSAREHAADGDVPAALDALAVLASGSPEFTDWIATDRLLGRLTADGAAAGWPRRTVRVAVLSSHTGAQLTACLRTAALAHHVLVETYESGYRTYEQEVLDPGSGLYGFAPDVVVLAVDHREVRVGDGDDADEALARETDRWTGLWQDLQERTGAVVVQHTFVPPVDDAWGELGASSPTGRRRTLRRLNLALGDHAPAGVHLVDAEAVATTVGGAAWFDSRYWYAAKQAVGLGAVGLLAQRTVDVVAAALGLGRKVVVLDLDNTLWGGVIGEDGLGGIVLGGGAEGEAYADFQTFLRGLRRRGIVLAVCSKNQPADARLPFERHPEMRLALDDLVAFEAGWDTKAVMLRRIAADIGVGLEALVLVDDNPLERAAVRHELPQVGVVELPAEPSGYAAALARFPGLQSATVTAEDARRTEQYRARRRGRELERKSGSREDFLRSLGTVATVEPRDETNRARIVQLIAKTNQLNLTGRRHTDTEVDSLAREPGAVVWALRVRDVFDDHGLVGALVAVPLDASTLRLDTFVVSCRVLGRDAERAFVGALVEHAAASGRSRVLGEFVPSDRNEPAASILADVGFRRLQETGGAVQRWELVIGQDEVHVPEHVAVRRPDPAPALTAGLTTT